MMGRIRSSLRFAVTSEARAYGFTLVIWTCGAFLVYEHGVPRAYEILAFGGGALAAMTLSVLVAFGGPRATWTQEEPLRRAFGAIRVVSVSAAMLIAWLLSTLPPVAAFAIAPFGAVAAFQMLLAVEDALSIAEDEDG